MLKKGIELEEEWLRDFSEIDRGLFSNSVHSYKLSR